MKKICFVFVLSIVSVFSVSAQTSAQVADKSTDNSVNTVEKAKVEKTSEINPSAAAQKPLVAEEQKAQTAETQKIQPAEEKKPEINEQVKTPETAVKKPEVNEAVKTTETVEPAKKPETEQPKTETSEAVKKAESPVLKEKKTLGELSTGNAAVDGYIEEFSELYNVDPLLIYAQMSQESSFKSRATSSKGASGYMQLMPATAARFGVTNIYNPKQNIRAGVKYMRWLLDKFDGNVQLALAGYNAGEGSVMKYGNKIPPYRETQNYVAKIMNHYNLISNQDSTLAKNDE